MIKTLITHFPIGMTAFVMQSLNERGVQQDRWPQGDELAPYKVEARVDHARWVVDCPFCPGACVVDFADPRTFCLNCHNERAEFRWVAVVLPSDQERRDIEAALEDGRRIEEMSWTPGQTVEQLIEGATVQGPQMHPDFAMQLAQDAGDERNRIAGIVDAYRVAHEEERRGALALVRVIERMRLEAEIRKQLNRDLQDEIDAFDAHGHEN